MKLKRIYNLVMSALLEKIDLETERINARWAQGLTSPVSERRLAKYRAEEAELQQLILDAEHNDK